MSLRKGSPSPHFVSLFGEPLSQKYNTQASIDLTMLTNLQDQGGQNDLILPKVIQ